MDCQISLVRTGINSATNVIGYSNGLSVAPYNPISGGGYLLFYSYTPGTTYAYSAGQNDFFAAHVADSTLNVGSCTNPTCFTAANAISPCAAWSSPSCTC